eukprot:874855-Prorocentrum_minimum.AAC.6
MVGAAPLVLEVSDFLVLLLVTHLLLGHLGHLVHGLSDHELLQQIELFAEEAAVLLHNPTPAVEDQHPIAKGGPLGC